ncbi:GNAT family N-acetyltransferase [Streptomyces sp. NPDC056480]|uniref:GNAT family N-acetyltransferase n=1 Tax=Streptomyces sp. NPDC056480 TaxID=3345833 RepID=UPI003692CA79
MSDVGRLQDKFSAVVASSAPPIELRSFSELEAVRGDLLDVYAEVRAPLLHLANYAVSAFGERLDRHGAEDGFQAVLAYEGGHPVGYAYGNQIENGDRYWQRMNPAPSEQYTARSAVALKEIGVRPAWRGTGVARRVHDGFLSSRDERYVTLMGNEAAGGGKVHALHRSWGYEDLGHSQPSLASPRLTVMIRPTRQALQAGPSGRGAHPDWLLRSEP